MAYTVKRHGASVGVKRRVAPEQVEGFKLFRRRRDGSLGPLFINRRQRLDLGVTYGAQDHPTKGYAHRPGWHACTTPNAPHLSERGRVWCRVLLSGVETMQRPASQGGAWYLAQAMTIVEVLDHG